MNDVAGCCVSEGVFLTQQMRVSREHMFHVGLIRRHKTKDDAFICSSAPASPRGRGQGSGAAGEEKGQPEAAGGAEDPDQAAEGGAAATATAKQRGAATV